MGKKGKIREYFEGLRKDKTSTTEVVKTTSDKLPIDDLFERLMKEPDYGKRLKIYNEQEGSLASKMAFEETFEELRKHSNVEQGETKEEFDKKLTQSVLKFVDDTVDMLVNMPDTNERMAYYKSKNMNVANIAFYEKLRDDAIKDGNSVVDYTDKLFDESQTTKAHQLQRDFTEDETPSIDPTISDIFKEDDFSKRVSMYKKHGISQNNIMAYENLREELSMEDTTSEPIEDNSSFDSIDADEMGNK